MSTPVVHVVVGVLFNREGQVLVALRPDSAEHLAGYWEFPGGKKEHNESPLAALMRELHEELGITVLQAEPLLLVEHDYPQKKVVLDVYAVTDYHGHAHGAEGQQTRWLPLSALSVLRFPEANEAIIRFLLASARQRSQVKDPSD